ncbi:hypothetical protein CHELA41_40136 [Hyphomicrobiales bacterium]|nr:hypothetical protein CHELA41_40136 [Hyphomicrobiales bacterium]
MYSTPELDSRAFRAKRPADIFRTIPALATPKIYPAMTTPINLPRRFPRSISDG